MRSPFGEFVRLSRLASAASLWSQNSVSQIRAGVGLARQPKATHFKPKQSGNPSGRRKARASFAALVRLELDKTITLGRGDNARTMTKRQVVEARFRKALIPREVRLMRTQLPMNMSIEDTCVVTSTNFIELNKLICSELAKVGIVITLSGCLTLNFNLR